MNHTPFPAVSVAVMISAALSGCTSTVIIHDYSTQGSKTHPDTVQIEKPAPEILVPPETAAPVSPSPYGSSVVPPDATRPTPRIPGRWSSIQPLTPGTARIETIISRIDSLIIFRIQGNRMDPSACAVPEAGQGSFDLDPEVWKNTSTDVRTPYLSVVFNSRSSWTDVQGPTEVLFLSADGIGFARFTFGSAEEVIPVQLSSGEYTITIRFPTTAETLETLAKAGNIAVTLIDGERRTQAVCSADNTRNFLTFYDVYYLGDGTKSMIPEGAATPGEPVQTGTRI